MGQSTGNWHLLNLPRRGKRFEHATTPAIVSMVAPTIISPLRPLIT